MTDGVKASEADPRRPVGRVGKICMRELREEVLNAAETSFVLTGRLFRTMNLIDPPAD